MLLRSTILVELSLPLRLRISVRLLHRSTSCRRHESNIVHVVVRVVLSLNLTARVNDLSVDETVEDGT